MKTDKILLDHGSGGKISHRMTRDMLLPVFNNPILAQLNVIPSGSTTPSFSCTSTNPS